MTTPLLVSLFYNGDSEVSFSEIQGIRDPPQMFHDPKRCSDGDCVTLGYNFHFASRKVAVVTLNGEKVLKVLNEWDIDEDNFVNELVHSISHETFHHIFQSWTDFLDIWSPFTPVRSGGTLADFRFDDEFNPFPHFVAAFSTDDDFSLRVWYGESPDFALLESPL